MAEESWGSHFRQRSFFKYDAKDMKKFTPGTVVDWNRAIHSKIFINMPQADGSLQPQLVAAVLENASKKVDENEDYMKFFRDHITIKVTKDANGNPYNKYSFKSDESLKQFFEMFLFHKVEDYHLRRLLAVEAFNNFDQQGILYVGINTAIEACTVVANKIADKEAKRLDKLTYREMILEESKPPSGPFKSRIGRIFPSAITNIYFTPTDSGAVITEESKLLTPKDSLTQNKNKFTPKEFAYLEKLPNDIGSIKCEFSFEGKTFTGAKGNKVEEVNATVNNLEIKTNPSPWEKMIDQRTIFEKIKDHFKSMFGRGPKLEPEEKRRLNP